jgi:predicted phosphohydrolase
MTVSTIVRPEFKFLISVQSPADGTWKDIGFVTKNPGKKLIVEKSLDGWILSGSKNRDSLLKSCKFLIDDCAVRSVDWVPSRPWTTFRTQRVDVIR